MRLIRIAAPINATPASHVTSRSKPVIGSVDPLLSVVLGVVDPVLEVVLAGVVVVVGVVEVVVVVCRAGQDDARPVHEWVDQQM